MLMLSRFSRVWLCATPQTAAHQAPPVPGILQARTLEWVAISFSNAWKRKVKVKLLSHVWLLVTPWTAAYQASLSMDFPGKSTGVGCHCLLRECNTTWQSRPPAITQCDFSSCRQKALLSILCLNTHGWKHQVETLYSKILISLWTHWFLLFHTYFDRFKIAVNFWLYLPLEGGV